MRFFGTSVEEAVKRVSKWAAAAYYTHLNSYYKLPISRKLPWPRIKISEATSQEITKNEKAKMRAWAKVYGKAKMRAWAKVYGKSRRQRNVKRDSTMDRAGTLLLSKKNMRELYGGRPKFESVLL